MGCKSYEVPLPNLILNLSMAVSGCLNTRWESAAQKAGATALSHLFRRSQFLQQPLLLFATSNTPNLTPPPNHSRVSVLPARSSCHLDSPSSFILLLQESEK